MKRKKQDAPEVLYENDGMRVTREIPDPCTKALIRHIIEIGPLAEQALKSKDALSQARAARQANKDDLYPALRTEYQKLAAKNSQGLSHRALCEAVAKMHEKTWRTVDRAVKVKK